MLKTILVLVSLLILSSPVRAVVIYSDGERVNNSDKLNLENGPAVTANGSFTDLNYSAMSGPVGIGTTQALAPLDVYRTSAWTYITDAPIRSSWIYEMGSTDVAPAIYGYSKNTGDNANGGGHSIGVLGIGEDTASNTMPVYGAEGRINWHSANEVRSAGLIGLAHWYDITAGNTTVFHTSSTNAGLITLAEIFDNDEQTPRYEGVNMGLFVNSNVGGFLNYGMKINAQTGGLINLGLAIGRATYRTLQVNDTTDSTDAPGGITFGVSGDVTLYRSAVNTLKTTNFVVSGELTFSGSNASTSAGKGACFATGNKLGYCTAGTWPNCSTCTAIIQ